MYLGGGGGGLRCVHILGGVRGVGYVLDEETGGSENTRRSRPLTVIL